MTELIMPKMGESVAEATILKWLKNEGDKIEMDEAVLEIATDKVDSEVPSPVAGILNKRLFSEGQVVKVGQAVALIQTADEKSTAAAPAESKKMVSPDISQNGGGSQQPAAVQPSTASDKPLLKAQSGGRFYSPLVRNIAREEGIDMAELDTVPGSGANNRVTKTDILKYISGKTGTAQPVQASKPATSISPPPAVSISGNVEIIEMDRMRRLIADHMVMSKHTSPHVTSYVEADVTNIVRWREKMKSVFEKRNNEKLTYTPIFIEAIVKAIKEFPMINCSVDGTRIILKKDIHIGMATALSSGNLIVPVIKNADRMNLLGLVKAVNDLASRARQNKLTPDEIQGGTYTITNVGTFGNVMGTPIINQPQAAILAVGAIRKKPAVIETPSGDAIGIRHMMFLSHSYDHRIIDGALGGSFVRKVADLLEQFDTEREI